MQCPRCGQDLPEEARFCLRCGTALTAVPAYGERHRERMPGLALALLAGCGGLVLLFVLVVMPAIVVPRVLGARQRAKEANARATLDSLRNAVKEFEADCHVYPKSLGDISTKTAPKMGLVWTGTAVVEKAINPDDWKGPYVEEWPAHPPLPINKLTGGNREGTDWICNPPGKPLGTVVIGGVTGHDSAGKPYSEW